MITYKILGILLTYPSKEIIANLAIIKKELQADSVLNNDSLTKINQLLEYFAQNDLIALQESYTELFDRGCNLSLYLFEHIHGESRDRGQAMVDLRSTYEEKGFDLQEAELPDYIPVFLEYLSTLEVKQAKELLQEPIKIFITLEKRLQAKNSLYSNIFYAINDIAGIENSQKDKLVKHYSTIEKDIDKEWEEVPAFTNNLCDKNSCNQNRVSNG